MQRLLQQVEPVIQHGLREVQGGAPLQHALREIAIIAALVGQGVPAYQAIQRVEAQEGRLFGFPPGGEPWEAGRYPGHGRQWGPGPGPGPGPGGQWGTTGPGPGGYGPTGPGSYGPNDMWRP